MSRIVLALVLFLLALGGYCANGRTIGAGDTLPAAHLPWSLLREGDFDLDEFPALHGEAARRAYPLLDGIPYFLQWRGGRFLSAYGPGAGVAALPIHALPVLLGAPPDARWVERLEKLAAAAITALSVAALYLALAWVTAPGWAFAIALVYAFGTSSLSVSSQGLWQHGPSQLCLALMLYCLARGLREARYLGYAGLPMAAAVAMRATDLLLVLPVAAWIAWAHRRQGARLALWALPPLAALTAYRVAHARLGADVGYTTAPLWAYFAQTPVGEGVAGVLASPGRGLFVYSPVLLFALAGIALVWRGGPPLWRALSLGPPLVVLAVGQWLTWWGGHSWGPRLLADLAPVLCFLLHPVGPLLARRRAAWVAFAVLALWSVLAHALGAWVYDRRWDVLAADQFDTRLWSWRDGPLAFYGREVARDAWRLVGAWPGASSASAGSEAPAAAYRSGPPPPEVMTGEAFRLPVTATNMGPRAWPATAPGDRGAVLLGWRWEHGERDVAGGRARLSADVPAGRSVQVNAIVTAPPAPGDHVLRVALVSEFVGWFGEHGDPPLRFAVRVLPRDVARMLAAPLDAGAPAPVAIIATDRTAYRAGDTLELSVTLTYWQRPKQLDGYLILEQGDGPPLFFDGHSPPQPPAGAWPPWVRGLPLPARAHGRFAIPVSSWLCVPCRWHVVLTEPGSYRPIARAATAFTVDP